MKSTRNIFRWTFVLMLVLAAPQPAQNQPDAQAALELEAKVEPLQVQPGDVVNYDLTVRWDAAKVAGMSLADRPTTDGIELLSDTAGEATTLDDGRKEQVHHLKLLVLADGTLDLPPAAMEYFLQGSDAPLRAGNRAWTLESSLVPPDDPDKPEIREKLAQYSIPRDLRWIYYAAGIALAVLLLGALAVYLIWRFAPRGGAAPVRCRVIPSRPPEEVAFERLDALAASTLLADGRAKEYFLQLSHIVREYLGARFAFPALDMTSPELEAAMERRVIGDLQQLLREFDEECDLAKFAKWLPPRERIDALMEYARDLVRLTTPSRGEDGRLIPSPYVKSSSAPAAAPQTQPAQPEPAVAAATAGEDA